MCDRLDYLELSQHCLDIHMYLLLTSVRRDTTSCCGLQSRTFMLTTPCKEFVNPRYARLSQFETGPMSNLPLLSLPATTKSHTAYRRGCDYLDSDVFIKYIMSISININAQD